MTEEPLPPGVASGRKCVEAIRALLTTFAESDTPPGERNGGVDVGSFVQEADPMSVYQLVALNAAMIRWASAALGRSESEILDELAANFESGSASEHANERRLMDATDPFSVMATTYGTSSSIFEIAKRLTAAPVSQHPGKLDDVRLESFVEVVGIFVHNDAEDFDEFRSGAPVADWLRDMMVGMVAIYEGDTQRAGEVVDLVLHDLAAKVQGND
ncbi:MAG: hypothetical protein ACLPVY_12550, partial [Acidimicrobiia bacterium]